MVVIFYLQAQGSTDVLILRKTGLTCSIIASRRIITPGMPLSHSSNQLGDRLVSFPNGDIIGDMRLIIVVLWGR